MTDDSGGFKVEIERTDLTTLAGSSDGGSATRAASAPSGFIKTIRASLPFRSPSSPPSPHEHLAAIGWDPRLWRQHLWRWATGTARGFLDPEAQP